MPTPAVVQSGHCSDLSAVSITFTQATTAGNCLVVVAGYQDQNTITANGATQSFTLIYDGDGGYGISTLHFRVWVAFNIAGGVTSLTFSNGTGDGIQAAFLEISGVTAQDGSLGSFGTGTHSLTVPSITASANDMLIGVFMVFWFGDIWDHTSPTNSFTMPADSAAVALSYYVAPSTGSYSTGASLTSGTGGSDQVQGFLFALTGSGGGGSPSVTQRLALLGVGA